jgi:hypothetical protein
VAIQIGVITRAGTWSDKDSDGKAWQDKDEDREAKNQRCQRELDCIIKYTRGGSFIVTRDTIAIVLYHYIPIHYVANTVVSL